MGIDMASRDELIAGDRSVEEIRETIGADSLSYLSIDAISETLGTAREDLCLGCVTGEYPYDIDGEETDRDVQRPVIGDTDGEPARADD
jgi:amidophosphoribosyltransferase